MLSQLLLFSDYIFVIGFVCFVVCGEWCCWLCFGHSVATGIGIQFLFMLLYSKGGLISTKQLLGAEEVNVIVHSAFKKLFELWTVSVIVSLRYQKLFNFKRGKSWTELFKKPEFSLLCYLLLKTVKITVVMNFF